MRSGRILLLTARILRERSLWRLSSLVFLVLIFSLVGSVARPTGTEPDFVLSGALEFTANIVTQVAYPFLFALVAVLVTLAIAVQREEGGLAALHTLGLRRWQILAAYFFAIHIVLIVPATIALLLFPPFVEPRLLATGALPVLYPLRFWAAVPRLLLLIVFMGLVAMAFAITIRRPAVVFGGLVAFFFVSWFLQGPLGVYAVLTPPVAFRVAYVANLVTPEGIPIDAARMYLLYLLAAWVAFAAALVHLSRRGEFA